MEAAVRCHPSGNSWLLVDFERSSLTLHSIDALGRRAIDYRATAGHTKLPSFGAVAWSPLQHSIVALGLSSGNASLIRLREDGQPSETVATYKLKQQRKCNSVAFGTQNWLAVALDKTRSDVCLNIYDAASDHQEPIRRLCAAELCTSVRFFSSQPYALVATTQRAFIRIYDLRGMRRYRSPGN